MLVAALPVAGAELQGHRGARGLAPENTLAGFATALAVGVDVLEVDLALTADDVVVASHDPVLNAAITRGPDGEHLRGLHVPIRLTRFADLSLYDVGRIDPDSDYADRFPGQAPVDGARIPRLADVFALVERAQAGHVRFNVETKIRPPRDPAAPDPTHFAARIVDTARRAGMLGRIEVQSFDWRSLAALARLAPDVPRVCLTAQQSWLDNVQAGRPGPSAWTAGYDVDAHGGSVPRLVAAFGCNSWSPHFRDLAPTDLTEAHALGLRVVVWTVNEPADIEAMLDLGVDGIISDYPDRVREAMAGRGLPLPPRVPARP